MSRLSKKYCNEYAFFIKSGTRKRLVFNKKCKKCVHDCKQSFRADLIACKNFEKKKEL